MSSCNWEVESFIDVPGPAFCSKQSGEVAVAKQGLEALQEQLAELTAEDNHTSNRLERLEEEKQGFVPDHVLKCQHRHQVCRVGNTVCGLCL